VTRRVFARLGRALVAAALFAVPLSALSGLVSAVPANAASAKIDRTIKDGRITESSGLAPSLLHPNVLWTHNDSGNPPRIYAIGPNGSTEAALTLRGQPNIDWEAIASFRGPPGSIAPDAALIAVGDIGDNNAVRSSVQIAIVREPNQLRSAPITPVRVLRLRYPGGPRDAETLMSDPHTGQLYVVSKTLFGSTLYSVPLSVWPGGSGSGRTSPLTTMTKVASMGAGLVTDGAFLPDGRMVLRGYDSVSVIDKPSTVHDGRLRTLASAMLPAQDQGESIALVDGGRQALIGSEGRHEPVLRVTLPVVHGAIDDGDTPTATALPTLPARTARSGVAAPIATGKVAGADPAFQGVGNLRVWVGVVGGGLALVVLTFGGLMLWTRR
jgi:hypothetical protein